MPRALDPKKRAEARVRRAKDESLNEIARAMGISYGSARRFTKGVRPDKERPPDVGAKIAATKEGRHDEWKRSVPRGECGTPGCDRVGCRIPYGECHCGCGEDATRALWDDRPRSWVRAEPHRYLQGHQRGGGTLMAAVNAEPLLAALERVEMARIEVARRAELGKGVIADLIGLEGYRLRRAHCERIISVLTEEFERQDLDSSELTLNRLFTEDRPANEPPVGRRARRGVRNRPPLPPSERGDGRHFRAAAERLHELCEKEDIWTHERAAEALLLQPSTLSYLRDRRRIASFRVRVGPLTATGYVPRDIKRLGLELRTSQGAWDRRRRDPVAVNAWALTHGATPAEARERVACVDERLRVLGRIRVGTGRPKSLGPPPHHYEWAQSFVAFQAELEEYARDHGEPSPKRWAVALAVAETDWSAHLERWPRIEWPSSRDDAGGLDPLFADAATQRIWNAVKRLQKPRTETALT